MMYLPPVIKLPPAIQQEYDELPTYEQSTDWQKRLFWILNGEGTKAEGRGTQTTPGGEEAAERGQV